MTNLFEIGDRVLYQGPLRDWWGQVAIVKEIVKGGELKLQFKPEDALVHACPNELTIIG